MFAVVTHDEIFLRSDYQLFVFGQKFAAEGNIAAWDKRLGKQLVVNVDLVVLDFYSLAWQADNAFDEIFAMILRVLENDNVSPSGWAETVSQLVSNNIIVVMKGGVHRGPGHFMRLGNKQEDG